MTTPHKWAKEIHAFADGALIESTYHEGQGQGEWYKDLRPQWHNEGYKFRIKSAPTVTWLSLFEMGGVDGVYYSKSEALKLCRRGKLMRLEIDPATFAATCVQEDV